MTWRQIARFYAIEQSRCKRRRADLIEAVAVGFNGKNIGSILRVLRRG